MAFEDEANDMFGQNIKPRVLYVHCRDGTTFRHPLPHFALVKDKSPILAACFERTRKNLQCHIEDTTREAVEALSLYFTTGSYLPGGTNPVPRSLILHLEVYLLAQKYDIFALRKEAHGQVVCEFDVSWCENRSIPDLVPAIEFLYTHLPQQIDLRSTFAHYTINCYHSHGLDQSPNFLALVYECEAFHADLCSTNFERRFEDNSAAAIVRLPVKPPKPDTSLAALALGDFLYDMWCEPETTQPRLYDASSSSSPGAITPPKWRSTRPTDDTTPSSDDSWCLPVRPRTQAQESPTIHQDTATIGSSSHETYDWPLPPVWKHLRPAKEAALWDAVAGIKEANGRDDMEWKSDDIDPHGHVIRLLTAGHGRSQLEQHGQMEVISLPSSPEMEEKEGFMFV